MRDSEATLQLIYQGMINAGIDAESVLMQLARSGHVISWDSRFDHSLHVAFWRVLEEHTGDPEIGLHLCPHLPIYRGRVFEYLFLSSPNYEQGLRTAFQYQRLVSDAFHVHLVKDDAGPRILIRGAVGDAPELRHSETCSVYAYLQAMEVVTDSRFKPSSLRLCCLPRAPAREYEELFGCPVTFIDTESEIWLDPELLKCRSPHSDPELFQLHRKYADNQLAQLARRELIDGVREYIEEQFSGGDGASGAALTLQDVARDFGVSARHLRFMLNEAGTTFRRLLKDARFGVACRTLKRTAEPVEEVAFRAGFSEPSTFSRAFKQWSGVTPYQFREGKEPNLQRRPGSNGH